MIESLLDLWEPVSSVLKRLAKGEMCHDSNDRDLLKELKQFMKLFKDFTLLFSATSPNLSMVPLVQTKIKKAYEVKASDSQAMKPVKKSVVTNLEKRIPINELVCICVAFDPTIRDTLLSRGDVISVLEKKYLDLKASQFGSHVFGLFLNEQALSTTTTSDNNSTEHTDADDEVESAKQLHLSLIQETKNNASPGSELLSENDIFQKEVTQYLALKCDDDVQAVDFWKKNATALPLLASMARIYLAICPGSLPVESLFSSMGLILYGKCSCLSPFRVNAINFIHDYHELI